MQLTRLDLQFLDGLDQNLGYADRNRHRKIMDKLWAEYNKPKVGVFINQHGRTEIRNDKCEVTGQQG